MNNFVFSKQAADYAEGGYIRFHLPGHKGKQGKNPISPVTLYDLTELSLTDNLFSPADGGSLESTYSAFRKIYGTESTIFSAAGATAALQAAISALVRKRGRTVICDRTAHTSVVYALCHCDASVKWVYRDKNGLICTESFICEIRKNTDAACIILTSPDYYGNIGNISEISKFARQNGIPLLVDSAHGAHLPFYKNGKLSAYKCGASFVVESLHKTLPALTGAALLHSDGGVDEDILITSMRHFASSSPSFPVLLSICNAVSFMTEGAGSLLDTLLGYIEKTIAALSPLGCTFAYSEAGENLYDPFRIAMRPPHPHSPQSLYDFLLKNKLVCEFYDREFIVLVPSVLNTQKDFDAFISLCCHFASLPAKNIYTPKPLPKAMPKASITMSQALLTHAPQRLPLKEALGRISAEPHAPYPPATPIIMPGEIFDTNTLEYLALCGFDSVWATK